MADQLVCMEPQVQGRSVQVDIDWDRCIICQEVSSEHLLCPATYTKRTDIDGSATYRNVAQNLLEFQALGSTEISVNFETLCEGISLADTFVLKLAKWHKTCKDRFNSTKLRRIANKRTLETVSSTHAAKFSRRSAEEASPDKCFFCEDAKGTLHRVSTFSVDEKVKNCASILQDTRLLCKLSAGDMISQDALYHAACLSSLYKTALTSDSRNTKEDELCNIALSDITTFVEEHRDSSEVAHVFKLADLARRYKLRLEELGVNSSSRIHTTRLKDKLLASVNGLQSYTEGHDVLLAFHTDVASAMKTCSANGENDEQILARAAKIIRHDIMDSKCFEFDGTFTSSCQRESIPPSLHSLVRMILEPPVNDTSSGSGQAALTISQLIWFNCRFRAKRINVVRHNLKREPPLPIYLAFLIHAETRKRGLIDKLYDLGLGVSYDRVLKLSAEMGNAVSDRYEEENVVCPAKLRGDLFTTGAVDNIDHNPSSTTSHGSFHGTGISLFQHPRLGDVGYVRETVKIQGNKASTKGMIPLPRGYTHVPPVLVWDKQAVVPDCAFPEMTVPERTSEIELERLRHVKDVAAHSSDDNLQDMTMSWAAFNSQKIEGEVDLGDRQMDIGALLPLFPDESKSVAMLKHSINIVKEAVDHINPGQTPVVTFDQPLFALAKQIQWNWPTTYGEDHCVIMFGGLHIEMAALKTIGDWLEGSGWTSALIEANIASSGIAESFLTASHVSRTLHAHQVTACALYIHMSKAYEQETQSSAERCALSFNQWKKSKADSIPQFKFWSITLDFEITILMYVRSLRTGNFDLYIWSLAKLLPWFFALDHINYARWLSVHWRDMTALSVNHSAIHDEFQKGRFVVQKTRRTFSSIPIDQAHEQHNKCVKSDGGAIGLMDSSSQLLRWMVSGPEIARAIEEFEDCLDLSVEKLESIRHHERTRSYQRSFQEQVSSLADVIESMGNPFTEHTGDLMVLDSRDIMDGSVVQTINQIQNIGQAQFKLFVEERLVKGNISIYERIKKNKAPLFRVKKARKMTTSKHQITSLKKDCSLFAQLYISCQVRNGSIDTFFEHENQLEPPSLSKYGQIRSGSKSDLLACFETPRSITSESPVVDAVLLDGAAVVNMLRPKPGMSFEQYSDNVFQPYVIKQARNASRIDVVWDVYKSHSLKEFTRRNRGTGPRRRVQANTKIPGNWESFLRSSENKSELFAFLAVKLTQLQYTDIEIITTNDNQAITNKSSEDIGSISPCNHEEADTRLLLHSMDASRHGHKRQLIRTVDTDVVVLAISFFKELNLTHLWIAFGTGNTFRYIAIHAIVSEIGDNVAKVLVAFHAFTGCDQISFFLGKGKKTAWNTWKSYREASEAFEILSSPSTEDDLKNIFPIIQHFVCLLYDKSSTRINVDKARKEMFTRNIRSVENIPPTAAALYQHTKRVAYQAGYTWGQTLKRYQDLPCPSQWGWLKTPTDSYEPFWTDLPEASKSCRELLKCGCQKGCRMRCKCVVAGLVCTPLCKCGDGCNRT